MKDSSVSVLCWTFRPRFWRRNVPNRHPSPCSLPSLASFVTAYYSPVSRALVALRMMCSWSSLLRALTLFLQPRRSEWIDRFFEKQNGAVDFLKRRQCEWFGGSCGKERESGGGFPKFFEFFRHGRRFHWPTITDVSFLQRPNSKRQVSDLDHLLILSSFHLQPVDSDTRPSI